MRETQAEYAHLNLPWILLGDYNVTLSSSEHSRSMDYRSDQINMRAFQEAVTDCSLVDLVFGGALFTWWNQRNGNPIGKKLDRALVNGDWLRLYPNSHAYFDAGGVSDHARCLIKLSGIQDEVRKPFRYFDFLADNEEFIPSIQESWSSSARLFHSRTALTDFHRKLKLFKPVLRAINRSHYGDITNRTKQAFEELCECQNRVLVDPSSANFAQAAEASDKWHKLARIEEKFYRQKSCIRWLQAGDLNTCFFHRSVQIRAARNSIRRLVTEQGEVLTSPGDIKRESVAHFQRFLQAQEQTEEISVASLQDLLTFRCPPVASASLFSPVTAQEIYEALLSLPNDKVSGPDGFTKEFYVAAWKVIGQDFITAIQSFFLFGFLPSGINATILSLIPKTENAEKMKDFRPIACCNLLYKVISKVLANRLRIIFLDAIEPNQSAFITGRLLLENVLLASELVNGYHKFDAMQRSAIKFDISKAFDTVKWSLITSVLKAMGLPL